MNEKFEKILKQIRQNIGLYSIVVPITAFLGRTVLGCYQTGYNYYFNVGVSKIDFSGGNIIFQLLLYIVLAGLLLFFNLFGYTYYKKRKLLVYLGCFALIFFIICSVFVIAVAGRLPSWYEIITEGPRFLLLSVAITVIFNLIIICYTFFPSVKDQIEIAELKLQKTNNKTIRNRLEQKLDKLKNIKSPSGKPDNLSEWPIIFKVSFCIGMACACFAVFVCIGYAGASSKRDFKIISNDYVEVRAEDCRDGFAVVFENNEEYVIAAYESTDGKMNLYINEQITISNKNVFTVEKYFDEVVCKM